MVYSKKAKCTGCTALKKDKDEAGEHYYCALDHRMSFFIVKGSNVATSPKPEEKCFKPMTTAELKEARGELTRLRSKKVIKKDARPGTAHKAKRPAKRTK